MKKLLCILLVFVMCASLLVACGDTEDTSKTDSKADSKTETSTSEGGQSEAEEASEETSVNIWVNEKGDYTPTNEIKNFGGERECSIIVRGDGGTYESNDFTIGEDNTNNLYGDTLDEAVSARNIYIEDTYGVVLKIYKDKNISDSIKTDISSSTHYYDIVMPTISTLTTLAQDGDLYDLATFDSIHLEAPWYDSNANETFSVNNQNFFTTGDITILNKVNTFSILFSKQMISDKNLDNPYTLVQEHKWTYDKMKEMAKSVTKDTDGESGMTYNDTWGLLASQNDALTFYIGADQHLCGKDDDDYPYLYLGENETSISVIQQILQDMIEKDTWVVYAQSFPSDIWVTSLDAFVDGRILFRPSVFSATTKLRKRGADFGILPLPLWNEEQEEYRSYCSTGETVGVGITIACEDPEFSAYMIEAISAASKNFITPAYMEVNLKSKDAQDDDSLEMLEIIFNNIVYDVGEVYNFGSIKSMFTNLVTTNKTDIASTLDSQKSTIQSKIDEVIETFEALQQ